MILTEFDSEKKAFINPEDIIKPVKGIPGVAIACYSHLTFERMLKGLKAEEIAATNTANSVKPVYKAKYKDMEVALFMIDIGAPASVAMLEDVFMMGVEKVVVLEPAACWIKA